MKSLFRPTMIFSLILLLSQASCAKQSDREYTNKDPKSCSTIELTCPQNQHPFYDNEGCGCTLSKAPSDTKHFYVNSDPKACVSLLFKCPDGQSPFFDEQGCGCQVNEECAETEKKLLTTPSQYQKIEIKDASVSFEIPKNWEKHGNTTQWSSAADSPASIGFRWVEIDSSNGWEPLQMLPKEANILGPYDVNLGWEKGLLYIVQLHEAPKPTEKTEKFEIHAIVPRMEAGIAYDFYASANSLVQLKSIDEVHQHFMQSGELSNVKRYMSQSAEECQDLEINCDVNEQEFSDDSGCGCESAPVEDDVYDN